MRGQWLKRCGSFIIALVLLCGFSLEVYAETESVEIIIPVYHELTETETESSDSAYALQRGAYLSVGTVTLSKNGSGNVGIYGGTTCTQTCDKVYLEIYLEQSRDGKNFYSYKSWTYTASNASRLNKSFNEPVAPGYYYRLRGYHAAKEGGVKESTSTMTNGKWIS